mgnify:CR=1 FL=1
MTQENYLNGNIYALTNLADVKDKNAQYHQAIYYLKEAESLLEETNELYLRARIYNKLGLAYKKLDLVGPSLNYLNKTIDLTEKEPGDNFKLKKIDIYNKKLKQPQLRFSIALD